VAALDGSRRSRRVRKGTGLPAVAETLPDAETLRDLWALEARQEAIHGRQPSRAVSIALEQFLKRPRRHGRKPGWREKKLSRQIALRFKIRTVGDIPAAEWASFAEASIAGAAASTRERFLNGLMAFLNWCHRKPRQWIPDKNMPHFERDAAARKPRHRKRRQVAQWRPELIMLFIDNAGWHLKPQLWVEWSTGQRVSAVLATKLGAVLLAPGREQITYERTKNGETVTASLHPSAAEAIREYLKKRGRLWDREGPLFLTKAGKPYRTDNQLSGHNRTAFNNARARAVAARRRQALELALSLRRRGLVDEAREAIGQARADMDLMRSVTQHWFRHLLATTLHAMQAPARVAMDQAGWQTVESYMAYAHDVPEVRRSIVNQLPLPAPAKRETA
jgi:site-specific recombinase XerD